uniref:Putative ran gtpase-activating protein n=1 Tax=Amblyomma aureolatum TaxID=187763 RepID=A0A1E1X9W8_9ACAR
MAAPDNLKQLADQLFSTSITDSKEVSFKGKALKLDNEKDADIIVEAITRCPKLEMLCLEGNTLGPDAAKAIGKALEARPTLKRALWKDMFTGRLKTEVPDAVRFLSAGVLLSKAMLTELDLSDNAFGPVGAEALVVLLSSPCCFQLEVLQLNNNGLGTGGAALLAKALTACITESTAAGKPLALRTFICGRNRLENPGAIALGAVFGKMTSLEEVALPQNGIYHEGIAALAKGLISNKNLRVLNLNDNTFTPEGARHMSQALHHLDKVEVINFGDCLIRTAGAKAIANALKNGHSTLKDVNLGYNELTLDGGLAIVEALKEKPLLETLELDGNKFGTEGVEKLEEAMEAASKIDKLCAFSDDEGSGDDDDDEEEEEDHEDDGGDGDEKDGSEKASVEASCSAEEFLSNPTAARLAQLGSQRSQHLLQEVESCSSGAELLRSYVTTFMKVASVVGSGEGGDAGKQQALDCSDSLLSAAFTLAKKENNLPWLTNELMVHLGLLKAEKDQKVSWSQATREGAMVILADLVPKEYFLTSTREALQAFLSKPQQLSTCTLGSAAKARHRLMQVLYQA